MSAAVPVTCPRCGHTGRLKNRAALGSVKPCPACGEAFRLTADPGGAGPSGGGVPGWMKLAGGAVAGTLLLLCAGAIYVGVDQAKEKAARQAANRAAAQEPPPPVAAATPADARALGEAFVAAAEAGDAAAVARLFDADALLDAALAGLEVAPEARRQFAAGFAATPAGLAEQYVAAGQTGGLRLLGADGAPGVDGPPGALVRMLPEGGGVNYLVLYPTPGGRIADMYVFTSGERFSATVRRLAGPMFGATAEERAGMEKLGEMNAAARRGDGAAAARAFDALPESLKADRGVQVARVVAAAAAGDPDAYAAVLADFDRRFPDDPTLDLLKIDALVGEPEKLVPVLERLDAAVGGDPHLRGLLAEYLPDVGRAEEAVRVGRDAVAAEPDLAQARFGLLAGQIGTADHAGAVGTLRELRDGFDLTFEPDDLAEIYAGADAFVDSPEYAAFAGEG